VFSSHRPVFIPLLLALLCTGCIRQPAGAPSERLAVLRLENLSGDASIGWAGRALSEIIATELSGAGRPRVITSAGIHAFDRVLGPRPTSAPGISAESSQALAAGATLLAYGDYTVRHGKLEVRLTLEDTRTSKATKVIGLAPCKDHNLCHASMTMKNWYGLLGGRRNQFHQFIHSIVSDFALMMKPTLVILDGMNVLMSNGPTGGRLSDVKQMNTIIAGTDMVAVDACGYERLMERDLAELTYIHKAHDRGLGNKNWKETVFKEVQA